MFFTPILHKPISYGSQLADGVFLGLIGFHVLFAVMAIVTGVLAVRAKKGSKYHMSVGSKFVTAMIWVAISGIVLDVVRLSVYVDVNHTKYVDYAMPSTYPARFAFLYAAICILYLLKQSGSNISRAGNLVSTSKQASLSVQTLDALIVPWVIGLFGIALTFVIFINYNPWTGALWMIWTFSASMFYFCYLKFRSAELLRREAKTLLHRYTMSFLLAFSGWAALQGFGPGITVLLQGVDNEVATYMGDKPGGYSHSFWLFLVVWLPFFIVGGVIYRYFSVKRQ